MFYYTINKSVSNLYDMEELNIIGTVDIFSDKTKLDKITTMSFVQLNLNLKFKDCPSSSKENFNEYIDKKVMEKIIEEKPQKKIDEIKRAKDLGILKEQ